MSIFQTPAPAKPEREGGSVTPMSGNKNPLPVADPMPSVRHVPNSAGGNK